MLLNAAALTAFLGLVSATIPFPTNGPANAICDTRTYTISVNSTNTQFKNVDLNANETIITNVLQDFLTSMPSLTNFTQKYFAGPKQVAGSYQISGTLCRPKKGLVSNSTVQLLVHGIGFDSSYWDFAYQPDYSYVYQAANAGYITFRYDRLGTGNSEKPKDAYNVVQAATDLAILNEIASQLRSGTIGGTPYTKIAGVGHSYGSIQLQALTSTAPKAVDAVVLTGFSANTSAVGLTLAGGAYSTAAQVFPARFLTLPSPYLVTLAPQTNQLAFFYFPYYAQGAFDLARQTEQPVTQGALLTFGGLPAPAPEFTGPVHVVTGDKDFIFCLRDCYAVPEGSGKASKLDFVAGLYPKASKFSTYLPANTGHGISAHYSAPEVYSQIQTYFKSAIAL